MFNITPEDTKQIKLKDIKQSISPKTRIHVVLDGFIEKSRVSEVLMLTAAVQMEWTLSVRKRKQKYFLGAI